MLCLRAWDEGVFGDAKTQRVELAISHQLRNGHALATASNHFAKGNALFLVGLFSERRVKFNPTATSHMCQQDLRIETRRFAAALTKKVGRPLQQSQHRPRLWRRFRFPLAFGAL